jgi:hypothetical protein
LRPERQQLQQPGIIRRKERAVKTVSRVKGALIKIQELEGQSIINSALHYFVKEQN